MCYNYVMNGANISSNEKKCCLMLSSVLLNLCVDVSIKFLYILKYRMDMHPAFTRN